MAAPTRKVLAGSIHRVREFELEKVCLAEEFDILQIVGEGWFGKILLVEHRGTDTEMVLKALPKPYVCLRDFYREFHYGLHLGAHKNIITTYDVAFETAGFYVFSQEYAPLGDLTSNVSDTGIGELHTKRVAKQLGAALDHVHARDLVHRDVKLDNILVFKSDFSRIKLCDFGETRKSQTEIRRRNEWLPYSPPEILQTAVEDIYKAVTSHDVWQFGIVIFVCLTGCLPWQKAALDDPRYVRYLNWYNTSNPLRKQPKLFKLVSSRAQKMFKRFLEPRPDKRPPGLGDLHKYIEDRWMAKGINEKNGTAGIEVDELCPSMYSFHSDIDEKNKLLHVLLQHGIETTVDRVAKKARIKDWIQNSVIAEEDENETDDSYGNSRYQSDEEGVERRETLHPIEKNHLRWSSLRYTDEKHINPRTGEVLDKGKPINSNPMTTVSYDMQTIQPITTADILIKHNTAKDESPSHGSIKDSAYGSLDLKPSLTKNVPNNLNTISGPNHDQKPQMKSDLNRSSPKTVSNNKNSISVSIQEQKPPMKSDFNRSSPKTVPNNKNPILTSTKEQKPPLKQLQYPSQQLQQHLQRQNINMNMNTAQYKNFILANSNPNLRNGNISSSKSSPSSSTEIRNSQSMLQKSSASTSSTTLARSSPQTRNPVQGRLVSNAVRAESLKSFVPMKDSPYDTSNNNLSKESNEIAEDSTPVIQGQMRINPYGTAPTNNMKSRVMNPQIVNLNKGMNGQQSKSKENVLEEVDTQESLNKIRQMLLESKTGLPE